MHEVNQRMYRLVDQMVARAEFGWDGDWVRNQAPTIELRWDLWQVEKVTPKGFWVVQVGSFWEGATEPPLVALGHARLIGGRRWINPALRSTLRLAPTKLEAAKLAVRKREYHASYVAAELQAVQRRLAALQRVVTKLSPPQPPEVPHA
jgi:hypothetical protein